MAKYKLLLEYDGSKFAGWQRQAPPNVARTVQEEVERAITTVFHEAVDVVGAGRTDAGVHARGQVAHAMFGAGDPGAGELARALRGVLPHDIVCRAVDPVDAAFHARYDAVRRTYSYAISARPVAIGRAYTWFVGGELNRDAMQRGAECIRGAHDFTAYSKENPEVKNRLCEIDRAEWTTIHEGLRFEISSNRFVYSMVRALVGALVGIGRGRLGVEEFGDILASRDRARNKIPLAPPHGLCLESVEYPSLG